MHFEMKKNLGRGIPRRWGGASPAGGEGDPPSHTPGDCGASILALSALDPNANLTNRTLIILSYRSGVIAAYTVQILDTAF